MTIRDDSTGHDAPFGSEGGGGGGAGAPVVRAFSFAFDTPDLLTGASLYTPTVGDVLLDAWVEILTAWNGTTPSFDLGTFPSGSEFGWWLTDTAGPLSLAVADGEGTFGPGLNTGGPASPASLLSFATTVNWPLYATLRASGTRALPARFTVPDDVKIVVSQDGLPGGADPGSTQGEAVLYLVTATPV